jgi:hypothetical protein
MPDFCSAPDDFSKTDPFTQNLAQTNPLVAKVQKKDLPSRRSKRGVAGNN